MRSGDGRGSFKVEGVSDTAKVTDIVIASMNSVLEEFRQNKFEVIQNGMPEIVS